MFPEWTSLESTKGIFNAHLSDIIEVKFVRPIPIKVMTKICRILCFNNFLKLNLHYVLYSSYNIHIKLS